MSEINLVKCDFYYTAFHVYKDIYTCQITEQRFEKGKNYQFDVTKCVDINDVKGIQLVDVDMPKVPQNFPWHQFPNLEFLHILVAKLKRISKESFRGLNIENLKLIIIESNDLVYLPGDLFDGMNNLEHISFWNNKIKYIEPELTESLKKLKFFDFQKNSNIDVFYHENGYRSLSMEVAVNAILENFRVPSKNDLIEENLKFRNEVELLKEDNNVASDMINTLKNEDTKDFIITVGDQEFKVHKFLLISRSPVFAEMIKNNPEAENLILEQIPLDIFQHILDFLYNDTLPQDGATFKDIFIASGRLKIEKLKDFAGSKLIDQVNEENAFDMLTLANKYDHDELRLKAFNLVKAMFPNLDLEDKLALDQESVNGLYEMKLMQDKFAKKLSEKFKHLKLEK